MTGIENYKNHGISIIGDEYYIFWFRGKEHFRYKVTQVWQRNQENQIKMH